MAYVGQEVQIPVGQTGLLTDESPSKIPPGACYRATNVSIDDSTLSRALGSLKWSRVQLPSGVVAAYDWWPNQGQQFLIAVTREGRVYRFIDQYTYVEVTPSGGAPETLQVNERVCIVEGGRETAGAPRKLFIFTGNNPIQVITDTQTVRTNLSNPAADWASNYPFFGIVHFGRLYAFGNSNHPHFVYASTDTDQEDFTTQPFNVAYFNIFPGEAQRLQTAFVYKGRLHVVKYPRGLYALTIQDIGDPLTWYFEKLNDSFGAASVSAATEVLDDVWMTNSDGAITSLSAAFKLGNLDSANVLKAMKVNKYVNQITSPLGIGTRQSFFHAYARKAYFTYRGSNDELPKTTLVFDLDDESPKLTINTKDQVNCYFTRRGVTLIEELFYGSEDGYIYQANRPTLDVGGEPYLSEYQTPYMDLGIANDKNFDFVEIEYIPTGGFNLFCDVYIDGRVTQTKQFYLGKSNRLTDNFTLGVSRLQGQSTRKQRLPIYGRGRSISLRFYTEEIKEDFRLTGVTLYFRTQGQSEKA